MQYGAKRELANERKVTASAEQPANIFDARWLATRASRDGRRLLFQ